MDIDDDKGLSGTINMILGCPGTGNSSITTTKAHARQVVSTFIASKRSKIE